MKKVGFIVIAVIGLAGFTLLIEPENTREGTVYERCRESVVIGQSYDEVQRIMGKPYETFEDTSGELELHYIEGGWFNSEAGVGLVFKGDRLIHKDCADKSDKIEAARELNTVYERCNHVEIGASRFLVGAIMGEPDGASEKTNRDIQVSYTQGEGDSEWAITFDFDGEYLVDKHCGPEPTDDEQNQEP